jgi:hypothetical protein
MNYQQRLEVLAKLGKHLADLTIDNPLFNKAYLSNNWFTTEMQLYAINNWQKALQPIQLKKWLQKYPINDNNNPKTVGIIMAGNIPLVGLHDLICVLATGNKALVKMSSSDNVLVQHIIDTLIAIEPEFANYIIIAKEGFKIPFDAVIATGSNNSNRYFEYYFKNKPGIFRANRNSLAVLSGNETPEDYLKLADDIFMYFGLGCRNVSKLFVPEDFDFNPFFEGLNKYKDIINHNKYANNYTYHKAIFLMNNTKHLDNGFVLLKEDEKLASPLSVVFYSHYKHINEVNNYIYQHNKAIQCVVSKQALPGSIPFGLTQNTTLFDYADGIDTVDFLLNLSK